MAQLDDAQKAAMLKQVEFYFSESNLPKDKFLKGKIAADPGGYVDLATVCAFSRMREHLKLPKDTTPPKVPADVVAAAAEVLKGSSLVEVDEEGKKVRRKEALGDEEAIAKGIDARSLYASPFPLDVTVDALTEFFDKHGSVKCVRQRRHVKSRTFKGSVFVEFADEETAAKVAGMKLEYAGAELHLEKKRDYLERKIKERKEAGKEGADSDADMAGDEPAPTGKGKKRAAQGGDEPDAKAAKGDDADEGGEDEDEAKLSYVPGCLVHFSMDAELPESISVHAVVDMLGGKSKVRFLELNEDRKSGFMRFVNPETASQTLDEYLAKPEDQQTMAGTKMTWRKVENDEEVQYYERVKKAVKDKQGSKGGRGRGSGRGGRGGRGGGRGGRRGRGKGGE